MKVVLEKFMNEEGNKTNRNVILLRKDNGKEIFGVFDRLGHQA